MNARCLVVTEDNMHLIGLVEHPDHVCCRYRLSPLEPFFAANGHPIHIRSIPRGLWARLQTWRSLREADAVILQRRLMACWHVRAIRRNARRLIPMPAIWWKAGRADGASLP
jgi:hypothetical protein